MWASAVFLAMALVFVDARVRRGNMEVISWTRNIGSKEEPMFVKETANVNMKDQMISMTSADDQLREQSLYKSVSYHDFKNKVLAIKTLGAQNGASLCLLTTPKNNFKTTVGDLRKRAGGNVLLNDMKQFRVVKRVGESRSPMINSLCKGASMFQLEPLRTIEPMKLDLKNIGRTLCIYYPLDYWWPIKYYLFPFWPLW